MMTNLSFKLIKDRFEAKPAIYQDSKGNKRTTVLHIYNSLGNNIGVRRDVYDHIEIWEDGTVEVINTKNENYDEYISFNVADVIRVTMYDLKDVD